MRPRIAVSGLHRGENPQPGAGLVRALRRVREVHVVGLAYDAYESGIFAEGGVDEAHVMPYPTCGAAAWLARLDEVRARSPFDFLIPTLDSEIDMLAGSAQALRERGIRCDLPEPGVLARRDKQRLAQLGAACDVPTPTECVARGLAEAMSAAEELGWPLFVKGPFYDARRVHGPGALAAAASAILADWGPPLILQQPVAGPELDVLGLGDGRGGVLGLGCIRKTHLSEKGKGIGAVAVRDPQLEAVSQRVIAELDWLGPFELEWIRGSEGYVLIEMNPRFPAWIDFAAQLGTHFAAAWLEMLEGEPPRALPPLPPGRFFLRHQIEVVGDVARLAELLDETEALIHSGLEARPFPSSVTS